MCTMGAVFDRNGNFTFKQCDLMEPAMFLEPDSIEINREVQGEKGPIQYITLKRKEKDGKIKFWGGINNYGVSFLESDSYILDKKMEGILKNRKDAVGIFEAYKSIISECMDAKSGAEKMIAFYKQNAIMDILLISDAKESYFIEVKLEKIVCVKREYKEYSLANYLVATNHFRYIYGEVPYEQNHSTYLRLQRAETIMCMGEPKRQIASVLSDEYYGETVLSICGINGKGLERIIDEDPYYTQASVIFYANDRCVNMVYLLNDNPNHGTYTMVEDVFNQEGNCRKYEHISSVELKRWLGKVR